MNREDLIPDINLQKYDYDLPQEKIANFPLDDRSSSKLLCVSKKNEKIEHKVFRELPELLRDDSMLIFNNTKVIAARLPMQKETGGAAELLCVEPYGEIRDPQIAMQNRKRSNWICIVGGKKVHTGKVLHSADGSLHAEITKRFANKAIVSFFWDENTTFADMIEKIGKVPLPPYIKRKPVESDKDRYQTVYADPEGSVAAPTAGLHFTPEVLSDIDSKGIKRLYVTLHVGPGTFKPIDEKDISRHDMHREMISVDKSTIIEIKDHLINNNGKDIICVGTTSVRTIETLYWLGAKIYYGETPDIQNTEFILEQWESYEINAEYGKIGAAESFSALLDYIEMEKLNGIIARTKLFIVPGYDFGVVKGIITNYHMPKSTLILLVAAFLGDDLWKKAYGEALEKDYRFLSYGDSSFLR